MVHSASSGFNEQAKRERQTDEKRDTMGRQKMLLFSVYRYASAMSLTSHKSLPLSLSPLFY